MAIKTAGGLRGAVPPSGIYMAGVDEASIVVRVVGVWEGMFQFGSGALVRWRGTAELGSLKDVGDEGRVARNGELTPGENCFAEGGRLARLNDWDVLND